MRKISFIFTCLVIAFIAISNVYAQDNYPTVRQNFPNTRFPAGVFNDTPGDSCAAINPERHDGFIHANGYAQFSDSIRWVIKMHPQSYPWTYNKVCVGFTRISTGNANLNYDICVYDTTGAGGSPGNLVAFYPAAGSATGIPVFPAYGWYSSTISVPVTATLGAVYIGIRFVNGTATNDYISSDEASPLWPGYVCPTLSGTLVWQAIQLNANFPNYKCLAIRTEGVGVTVAPLCEQFTSTTFPPTGWTLNPTTSLWYRATNSGFGVGTGSAAYDCWNGASGVNNALITLNFTPTVNPLAQLFVDMAYQPYNSLDSLVILTSTNGGTAYTSLARLGGATLATTTLGTSPFNPTASQWAKRFYTLPVGTNKVQFFGKSGFGDLIFIDSTCVNDFPLAVNHNGTGIPQVYSLSQNYPNPFNPSTQISFGLPKAGTVKLVVYDILGREVKTLVNDFRNAGTYNIAFDASSLASGIYFYTIKANDFTETKKMLLVK